MIWLMTWRTLTSKTVETRMMKAGRQRTRWRQSRMTASSPSPNTLVAPLPWVYYDLVIRQIQSVKPFTFPFLCPGSVFCVSLDPATNSMAVTGGEDDKAYVWRLSDGEVLLECSGECGRQAEGWLYTHSRVDVLRHERKIYIRFFADSDYQSH